MGRSIIKSEGMILNSQSKSQLNPVLDVNRSLARSAVVKVLMRKAGRFKDVLHLLQEDLRGQEYRAVRPRHEIVEVRGWDLVKRAKY